MPIRRSILILVIVSACFVSYFNSIIGDFVFDDVIFILENPHIQSFKYLPKFFTQDFWSVFIPRLSSQYYRPILAISLMIDYSLWKHNAIGYHLTNMFLHSLASILLFLFIELLIRNRFIAFCSALLFSVHPIHTEVVSWISGRVDSVPFIFFFISLVFYLKYASDKKLVFYLFSLICFFISLIAKEISITLPLIVICIDYLFLSQKSIASVIKNFKRFHFGFFVVLGIYLTLRFYLADHSFISESSFQERNFASGAHAYWRLFTVIRILFLYIRLLFIPFSLNAYYSFSPSISLFEPIVIFGIATVSLLILVSLKNIKKHPILSFSIFWFFITVLPVSNIFPQGNIVAERFMYLPSVGFCIGIAYLFSRLLTKDIKTRYFPYKKSLYVLFSLFIIAQGRLTYERNKVWENNLVLWRDIVEKVPHSSTAHLNLGITYYGLNLLDKALDEVEIALKLKPHSSEIMFNLGRSYLKKGLITEAINEFEKSITLFPEFEEAHFALSAAYYLKGEYIKAIEAAQRALKNNPNLAGAYYNLALSYHKIGLFDEAINAYNEYLKIKPKDINAHLDIGYIYYKKGNFDKAKEHWLLALKIYSHCQPAKDALKLLDK